MTYTDLVAVEKFAEDLKVNFPILLRPQSFSDRILNITNEAVHAKIDLALEVARDEFNKEVMKEASAHGE